MYKEHIQKMPSMAVKGKKKRRIVTEFETRTPQISHRSAPPSLGHIPNSDAGKIREQAETWWNGVKWFPASRNIPACAGGTASGSGLGWTSSAKAMMWWWFPLVHPIFIYTELWWTSTQILIGALATQQPLGSKLSRAKSRSWACPSKVSNCLRLLLQTWQPFNFKDLWRDSLKCL